MNKKLHKTCKALAYIFVVLLTFVVSYGLWGYGKQLHYNLIYKDLVEETVGEMVLTESLK